MRTESTELLPRYSFLAPLIRGARILELGALERTFGASSVLLHDRGAASVVAFGNAGAVERARKEHEGPGLSFRTGSVAQQPGSSFDLVLVHDEKFLGAEGGVVALSRLLVPGGHLVVAVRAQGPSLLASAGANRYAQTVAALRPWFRSIEVATQQALLGWVMTPAAGAAARLAIDGAFGGGEQPAFHLFLCGAAATGLAAQILVPVPAEPVLAQWGERGVGVVLQRERSRIEELVAELRHARARIAERESWIEGLRHEVETLHATVGDLEAERKATGVKQVKLEREAAENGEALRRVREQLVARARELDGARRAVDSRTEDLRLVEEELEQVREAAAAIQRERAALEAAAGAREVELAAARERIAALEAELAALQTHPLVAVEQEQALLAAEIAALRGAPPSLDRPAPQAAAGDEIGRRLRSLEEAAEAAERRAREAEERMRAAERRAEQADAARTESVATARRWQLEAENARREAAGVAAGMADRESLRAERDEAVARAAEEAGRRAAARAQLQREVERAEAAERSVAQLRGQLERAEPTGNVTGPDRRGS